MPNTYTSLHYHIVFSTKNRQRTIKPDIEQQVWEIIGGVARHHKLIALQVGGIEDHVHALIIAPPTVAPSQIAQFIKSGSSQYIRENYPALYGFAWQEGFGAFTVGKSGLNAVIRYIENQRSHHQTSDFQTEYLELLRRHNIAYDERYLWG